jgi:hypothetical protein
MQTGYLPTGHSFLPIGLKKRLREMTSDVLIQEKLLGIGCWLLYRKISKDENLPSFRKPITNNQDPKPFSFN